MNPKIKRYFVIAAVVFVVALIVSVATDGTLSDIGFLVYVAAFVGMLVFLAIAVIDRTRGTDGARSDRT